MYVCPPTVTVAVRDAPVFAATVTTTVPVPVPLAGATVAHAALLDAVQPHVVALAVTVTLSVPPVAPTLPVVDDSVNVQGGGNDGTGSRTGSKHRSLRLPVGPTAATRAS